MILLFSFWLAVTMIYKTIVGMPLNLALKDPTKPCYPLLSFVHLQAEAAGKAELSLRIVDTKVKKSFKLLVIKV